MAVCFIDLSESVRQIRKKAIPIMMYSAVHIGANSQFGGLNQGLLAMAYQLLTPDEVNKPATAPTNTGINIEINSFMIK